MAITEIFKQMQAADTIIIHRHVNPDPDALGSSGGLQAVLQTAWPKKRILLAGGNPGNLAWLKTMDTVTEADYEGALVVVVDTANVERIDGADAALNLGAQVVKIDHHPNDDPYGAINWVRPEVSSTSELIIDFAHANDLTINQEAARLLYAGMVGDTGRFMFKNTSEHTMAVAGEMMAKGIDFAAINNRMNQLTLAQARLQGYVFEHMVLQDEAAITVISQTLIHELGLAQDEVGAAVGTMGRLAEVRAWILFIELPEGGYRARLRSKGPVINELAKRHGGGGHPQASGANAKDQAEINQMLTELVELVATDNRK